MRRVVPAAALLVAVAAAVLWAQKLLVSERNETVRISAPDFHFLTGKPLERIQNGTAVAYDFQLLALAANRTGVLARAFERYVISYDLWEQSYSVSRMRSQRGQASHLTLQQAETWCIEGIAMPVAPLPKDEPVYFRLEVRAQDGKAREPVFDDPSLSLSTLIDVFSRATKPGRTGQWQLEAGPIRLKRSR